MRLGLRGGLAGEQLLLRGGSEIGVSIGNVLGAGCKTVIENRIELGSGLGAEERDELEAGVGSGLEAEAELEPCSWASEAPISCSRSGPCQYEALDVNLGLGSDGLEHHRCQWSPSLEHQQYWFGSQVRTDVVQTLQVAHLQPPPMLIERTH